MWMYREGLVYQFSITTWYKLFAVEFELRRKNQMGLRILNRVLGVHWAMMVSAEQKNETTPNKPAIVKNPKTFRQVIIRARICKPFKEPRIRFPGWVADTTTLFNVPGRQATWAGGIDSLESIPWNRFLDSLNVYKFGLTLFLTVQYSSLITWQEHFQGKRYRQCSQM